MITTIRVRDACTEVQVFHRQYREKEAKTGAKVEILATCLFLYAYWILARASAVLGD